MIWETDSWNTFCGLIEPAFGFGFGKEKFHFQLLHLFFPALRQMLPVLRFFHGMRFQRGQLFLRAFLAARHVLNLAFLLELPGRLFFLERGMQAHALLFLGFHGRFPLAALFRPLLFQFFQARLPELLSGLALRLPVF